MNPVPVSLSRRTRARINRVLDAIDNTNLRSDLTFKLLNKKIKKIYKNFPKVWGGQRIDAQLRRLAFKEIVQSLHVNLATFARYDTLEELTASIDANRVNLRTVKDGGIFVKMFLVVV